MFGSSFLNRWSSSNIDHDTDSFTLLFFRDSMIAAAGVLSDMHTFIIGERPVGLTGNADPCRRTARSDYLTHNSFQRKLRDWTAENSFWIVGFINRPMQPIEIFYMMVSS
jgi:hypothetical protein